MNAACISRLLPLFLLLVVVLLPLLHPGLLKTRKSRINHTQIRKMHFFLLLCPIRNLSLTVALNFNLTLARTLTLTITITITTTSTSTITITVTLGLSLGVFRELLCVQDDFGGWNLSLALELRV